MSKYTNVNGDANEIIKTDSNISNNLRNAKCELNIDKNKYHIMEYTEDYVNNLFKAIDGVNNNWNNLLNISIAYHDEIDYKDEVNYTGINNSIQDNYVPEPEKITAKVNTTSDYLNLRNSPSGNIINSIAPGTEVEILEPDNNGWTKIRVGDTEAYVCSRYITPSTPLEVIDTKSVSTDSLRVMNFPNGSTITNLPYNSNVEILAENNNGWTKILYDGKIAYAKSEGIR